MGFALFIGGVFGAMLALDTDTPPRLRLAGVVLVALCLVLYLLWLLLRLPSQSR